MSTMITSNQAQVLQEGRHEVVLSKGEKHFDVASAKEDGLYLFRQRNAGLPDRLAHRKIWQVQKLDTTFQVVWEKQFYLHDAYEYESKQVDEGYFHLLFRHIEKGTREMKLVSFDSRNGDLMGRDIKGALRFSIQNFHVLTDGLVLDGQYGDRPIAILHDFEKGVPRLLPGLFIEKSQWLQLEVGEGKLEALVGVKDFNNQKALMWRTYDDEGNMLKSNLVRSEIGKGLTFGKMNALEANQRVLAGTYGHRNSEYSRGVFMATINEEGKQKVNYYNYGDLKNFFGYMKEKREQRVLARIARRKSKDKKIRFNYRFLVHKVLEKDDQFILLGEAFYPKYRSVANNSGNFNSFNGMYNSTRIFDGYRYTHAVIMAFDKQGNLLWDNSFKINDVISFELAQFVDVSVQDEKVVLLYINNNVIHSKVIEKDNALVNKAKADIKLKFENDVAEAGKARVNGLKAWYDKTFFAYGTQNVKNFTNGRLITEREVFFINKVSYQ